MDLNQKNCFLFDMDGVLYDSLPVHVYAWCGVFERHGITLPKEEVYLNEGRPGRDTIGLLFDRYKSVQLNLEQCEQIYQEKIALTDSGPAVQVMPHMQELVARLQERGKIIGVVTGSKQPSLVDRIGKDFGIQAERIVTAGDLRRGKPAPDPYLMGLRRCNSNANSAVVVENAPLGVQAAVAAGIDTLAMNTGILSNQSLLDSGAVDVFSTPASLSDFITRSMEPGDKLLK